MTSLFVQHNREGRKGKLITVAKLAGQFGHSTYPDQTAVRV